MLVLSRKPGEGLLIGDDITVKIIDIKGGGIRIGIEAPTHMKIYREEVYDRIRKENISAATNWNMNDLDVLSGNLENRTTKK